MNYLYALIDPYESATVRYIGISIDVNRRFREHLNEAKNKKTYKDNWINSLLVLNLQPRLVILDKSKDWKEIQEMEKRAIAKYRQDLFSKLTNLSDGGQGGLLCSPERLAKQKEDMKGNKYALGYRHSKLTREFLSKKLAGNKRRLGLKHRPETIERFRITRKGCKRHGELKPYNVYDITTGELIFELDSARQAMEIFNVPLTTFYNYINKKRPILNHYLEVA